MHTPMHEPTSLPASSTFVIRFWCEGSGPARWRGRIEHLQSGQHADFLALAEAMSFVQELGVMAGEWQQAEQHDPQRPGTGL
jgi:hypothetical protein